MAGRVGSGRMRGTFKRAEQISERKSFDMRKTSAWEFVVVQGFSPIRLFDEVWCVRARCVTFNVIKLLARPEREGTIL